MKLTDTETLVIVVLIAVFSLIASLLSDDLRQSLEFPYLLLTCPTATGWLIWKSKQQEPPSS
jgi:hypothetical protein